MKILGFFYLLPTLILVSSSSEYITQIIDFHRQTSTVSHIYNNLMRILTSCKNNHSRITIFMNTSSNIHPKWLSDLSTHSPAPMRLQDMSHFYKYEKPFIVADTEALVYIIESKDAYLKFMFFFLLHVRTLDKRVAIFIVNPSLNGCQFVETILANTSRFYILTTSYLCSDDNNRVKIYTSNDLTNRKPYKWKLMEEQYRNKSSIPIYERYGQEEDICGNLYFDRTKFLDRYNVTIGVHMREGNSVDKHYNYTAIRPNYKHFLYEFSYKIIDPLASSLNTSIFLVNIPRPENMTLEEYAKKYIYKYKLDLVVSELNMHNIDFASEDCTSPYPLVELRMITYNWGYKSPIEKICNFYGIWTLLFTLFVLTLVFIVIWHSERKKPAFVFFEIIRLLIGHGLHTRMRSLSMRCFFGVILIYFLVIQATFNGNLAKFLTKPELKKHIDTLEDLQNVDPNVIFYPDDMDERFRGNPQYHPLYICVNHILFNDNSAVCICDLYRAYVAVMLWKKGNLHLSTTSLSTGYAKNVGPKVFKIHERLSKYFIWHVDLGFAQIFSRQTDWLIQFFVDKSTEGFFYDGFKPLYINDLTFSFVLLAIGLVVGSICFCIEIVYEKKMLKLKNQPRNCKIKKRFYLSKLLRK